METLERIQEFDVKQFQILYTATLIMTKDVIPAKAGIQENTGFPRIKYGAGSVKPGMTNWIRFMSSCLDCRFKIPHSEIRNCHEAYH
jgi:hypothetical protein